MTTTALTNARIVTETEEIDCGYIVIDGPQIVAVGEGRPEATAGLERDMEGKRIVPGYIDIQVNGGGGVLFNDSPTVEGVETIAAAHRAYGVTGLLPTLISDDLSVIEKGLKAVDEAIARGVTGVLGVHVEGPFLNAEKRGIHDEDKIRRLTDDAIGILTSAKKARVLLTVAPECVEPAQIKDLVKRGVMISAGHTNATYDEARLALEAGISCFTHLFNAMSALQSRAPGVIGAALESDAWCGVIVDGIHVHPAMLRLALRAKADRRFILVSDAMPTVGSDLDHFYLGGRRIALADDALRSADGTLAGAALDMGKAVRNAVDMLGVELMEAVRFASLNPATFLGVSEETGSIAAGKRADLAVLSDDLAPMETWIGGVKYAA